MLIKRSGFLIVSTAALILLSACNMPTATPTAAPTQGSLAPECYTPALYINPNGAPSCPVDQTSITMVSQSCTDGIAQIIADVSPADALITRADINSDRAACSQPYNVKGKLRIGCTGSPGAQMIIIAESFCKVSDQINLTCPPGYQYHPDEPNQTIACSFIGSASPAQTQCGAQEVYSPTQHCCILNPKLYTITQGFCPAGYQPVTVHYGAQYISVCADPTEKFSYTDNTWSTITWTLPACPTPVPPKQPKACKPPAGGCPSAYQWDQTSCSCVYVPG